MDSALLVRCSGSSFCHVTSVMILLLFGTCARRESNPHATKGHTLLRRARLPLRHSRLRSSPTVFKPPRLCLHMAVCTKNPEVFQLAIFSVAIYVVYL